MFFLNQRATADQSLHLDRRLRRVRASSLVTPVGIERRVGTRGHRAAERRNRPNSACSQLVELDVTQQSQLQPSGEQPDFGRACSIPLGSWFSASWRRRQSRWTKVAGTTNHLV